jgi:hypothetical protein
VVSIPQGEAAPAVAEAEGSGNGVVAATIRSYSTAARNEIDTGAVLARK